MKIPSSILWTAVAMIGFVIALAAMSRRAPRVVPAGPPVAERDVAFADRPDGSIAVLDGLDGHELASVPARSGGFIRGVLRGMFRTRKLEALGHDGAFHLLRAADGRLAIEDPRTGHRVDLESFGPTNAAAFAQLLVIR